jgi:hypothetical protein
MAQKTTNKIRIFILLSYKEFCKRGIYHCHYAVSGFHDNQLSGVNMLHQFMQ